jgi:hypothetical protein
MEAKKDCITEKLFFKIELHYKIKLSTFPEAVLLTSPLPLTSPYAQRRLVLLAVYFANNSKKLLFSVAGMSKREC